MSLGLRNFCRTWSQSILPMRQVQFPPVSQLEALAEKLGATDASVPPHNINLSLLKKIITQAALANNFSSLAHLDWRYSPFALGGEGGILFDPTLLQHFLTEAQNHANPRLLRGLARTYIESFSQETHTVLLS